MEYLKSCLVAAVLSVVGNVSAMIIEEKVSETTVEDIFRKPLAEWPKVHPFSSQKEMDYYKESTWNPQLTLEENQKELVKSFINKCCDFSFKISPTKLKELYFGNLDSGESLVFFSTSTSIYSDHNYDQIILYNKNHEDDGCLVLSEDAATFFDYQPLESGEVFKSEFEKYFSKLAEDSVGCKLLRIFLAKSAVNKFSKIAFVPVRYNYEYSMGSIVSVAGNDVCYHLADLGYIGAIKHLEKEKRHRFILFSPTFFSESAEIEVLRYLADDLSFEKSKFLQESALFHEILHSLHMDVDKKLAEVKTIQGRSKQRDFEYFFNENSVPCRLSCDQINVHLFHNDEEYHTIHGLTSEGLDLLNESSYLAHKYGFIRLSHEDTQKSEITINEITLSRKKSCKFIRKFFRKYGDHDLFRYYLSPNSPIKFPEFGFGQYKCADIDPKTGEKIMINGDSLITKKEAV